MAIDLFTFGIPFFFMLAVVFGALEISGVFQNRGVKAIIAIVIGFFAATNEQSVEFIISIMPYASIFFVIVFFLGFLTKAREKGEKKDWLLIAVVMLLLLIVLVNFEELTGITGDLANKIVYVAGTVILIVILYSAYQKGREQ